jgi:hypothetical protein
MGIAPSKKEVQIKDTGIEACCVTSSLEIV